MSVWLAGPEEARAVARLLWEFGHWFGGTAPPEEDVLASVERIMGGRDGVYLLGAPGGDGDAQGVCQLRFRWSVWKSAEDAWLEDLFVREEARRSGLGRELVEAALTAAGDRGCKRIELDVQQDNPAALALYEACGFRLHPKGSVPTLFISRPL